jgi:hypothetical protein
MEQQDQTQVKLGRLLILTNLKDLGIAKVEVTFSGSGDSGDIDEVNFYTINDLDVSSEIITDFNNKSGINIDNELRDFAYELIEEKVNTVGDWVNNEGGFGNITINVEEKTYDLNYSQRTTEEHDWSDEMLFI